MNNDTITSLKTTNIIINLLGICFVKYEFITIVH